MKVIRKSVTKACIIIELSEEEALEIKLFIANGVSDLEDYEDEEQIIETAEDFAKKLAKALD